MNRLCVMRVIMVERSKEVWEYIKVMAVDGRIILMDGPVFLSGRS